MPAAVKFPPHADALVSVTKGGPGHFSSQRVTHRKNEGRLEALKPLQSDNSEPYTFLYGIII